MSYLNAPPKSASNCHFVKSNRNHLNKDSIENLFDKKVTTDISREISRIIIQEEKKEKEETVETVERNREIRNNKNNRSNKNNRNNQNSFSTEISEFLNNNNNNNKSEKHIYHHNNLIVPTNVDAQLNSKMRNINEEQNKYKKTGSLKQKSDIYNYNGKYDNQYILKNKCFDNNENIISVRSLNFERINENNEFDSSKEGMKNAQSDNTNNDFDDMFSKKEFKIEKIKETYQRNKNNHPNNKNKAPKNPTSIFPFHKIMEEQSSNNIISKKNINQLYSHRNMYNEDTNNYNNNYNNNNLTNITNLRRTYGIYDNDTHFNKKKDTHMKDPFSANHLESLPSKNRNNNTFNNYKLTNDKLAVNKELSKRNWEEPFDNTNTNSKYENGYRREVNEEWDSGLRDYQNGRNILHRDKPEEENMSQNKNCDYMQQMSNFQENNFQKDNFQEKNCQENYFQGNTKMAYYSVVNHYNPYTNKENSPEKKIAEMYNQNIYENDIYDYLLNQYEKNYKKLILQNQPIRKALAEYLNEENDVDKEQRHQEKEKGGKRNEEEKEEGDDGDKDEDDEEYKDEESDKELYHNKKNCQYESDESDESDNSSNDTNEKVKIIEKKKGKDERKKKEMNKCKLIPKKDTSVNRKFFSRCNNDLQQITYTDQSMEESINKTEHRIKKRSHIFYNEDTLDIYKDIESIHTHKPQLFVYAVKSKKNSSDVTLKINKECKKVFKQMKNKNTVIISNIGRKSGSSTFSNFIINNPQINNFTNDMNNKEEECVNAYITTNKNKINYIYLDYDKINVNTNSYDKRNNEKNQKQKTKMKTKMKRKTSTNTNTNKKETALSWKQNYNKFVSLSFYFSNIVIIHIDSKNYLDMFVLISNYYTVIKNIKRCIRQKRKNYKTEKRRKEKMNNQKDDFLKLNRNSMNQNSSMEHVESDSSYLESDDSKKDIFDESNFYVPYFIFVLKDINEYTMSGDSGNRIKETTKEMTKGVIKEEIEKREEIEENRKNEESGEKGEVVEKGKMGETGTNEKNQSSCSYKNAQEYIDNLVSQIEDRQLKIKVEYVFSFITKKNFAYLPPMYKNKMDNIINYEYIDALKNIKKNLFIQSKTIDNMYNNNGLYIYKYLNMIVYAINNDVYYSPDNLKRKIEIFENKMLHDVLTENFLISIRNKMEKVLPLKSDFLLTFTNGQKIDYVLTYEKFAVGNETVKRKHKKELINNIDNIILKAYKENLAFSYFTFFNEINKKIENLKITEKIKEKTYETFDQLLNDLKKVNDEQNEHFVYNEIFNKIKEDILANFVKIYYQTNDTQKTENNDALKRMNKKNGNSIIHKKGKNANEISHDLSNSEMKESAEFLLTQKNKYEQEEKNRAGNKTTKNYKSTNNLKYTNRKSGRNGITHISIDDAGYAQGEEEEEEEKEEEEEEEEEEREDGDVDDDEDDDDNEEKKQTYESGFEEEDQEQWREQNNYNICKNNSKTYKYPECFVTSGKSSVDGSTLNYIKSVYQSNTDIRCPLRRSTFNRLKNIKKLKNFKNLNNAKNERLLSSSSLDTEENSYTKDSSVPEKTKKNYQYKNLLKKPFYNRLYKNKSDRFLADDRKKQIRKSNPIMKKYHSLDCPNETSNITIYKHLMNYEHSQSSEKNTEELFHVPPEYYKDEHARVNKKKDFSYDNTYTGPRNNIGREHSEYWKRHMKYNYARQLTENKRYKKSCLPRSSPKTKSRSRRKAKCAIM